MKEVNLKINGMHCESCEKLIRMNLEELEGVSKIKIDAQHGTGTVKIEDGISLDLILQTIGKTGYKAQLAEVSHE